MLFVSIILSRFFLFELGFTHGLSCRCPLVMVIVFHSYKSCVYQVRHFKIIAHFQDKILTLVVTVDVRNNREIISRSLMNINISDT